MGIKMKEELVVQDLREIKKILDKHNIEYWLDWGTLLGAVRDGKIIEWDDDIDFGMMAENWEKLVSAAHELKNKGFKVGLRKFKIRGDIFQHTASFQRLVLPINFDIYQVKGESAFRPSTMTTLASTNPISRRLGLLYCWLQPFSSLLPLESRRPFFKLAWFVWKRSTNMLTLIVIPKRYFEKLDTIKFYGITFNIPSDVENFLKYHYGEWRKPDREWRGVGGNILHRVRMNKTTEIPI